MEACEGRVMPVMQDERLVGLITPDNLTDFLMLSTATSSTDRMRGWSGG